MQLSRLAGHAQRLVGTKQMPLPDDFVEILRPHQLRQRRRRLPGFEQVSQDENRLATEDTESTEENRIQTIHMIVAVLAIGGRRQFSLVFVGALRPCISSVPSVSSVANFSFYSVTKSAPLGTVNV